MIPQGSNRSLNTVASVYWLKYLNYVVPTSLPDRVKNLWTIHRPRLKGAIFPMPWPDFTEAEVELSPRSVRIIGSLGEEAAISQDVFAHFPEYPPNVAVQQGWFSSFERYQNFAALVFAHRNRDHPYSEYVRSCNPELTDQEIVAIQKGWQHINWLGEGLATLPPRQSAVSRFFTALPANAGFLLFYGAILSLFFILLFPDAGLNFLDVYPFGLVLAMPVLIGVRLHDQYEQWRAR